MTTAAASSAPCVVAAVVIGRNEGERLRLCLQSLLHRIEAVVYVDSGSTDGSADLAAAMGATVVRLDMQLPFTAARARNEGFSRLAGVAPEAQYVQFVDGDCELLPTWLGEAAAFLDAHADVAAACGRRRERYPDRSVYNRLCDIEWNTPVGETRAFGGDVLMRAAALRQVGGYRTELIAGEEPELGVRLRAKGWRIWRLDAEMTWHDAAITSFSQWWRRMVRTGYAFAQGSHLHGGLPERFWVREARSAWAWGLALPLAVIFAGGVWGSWALAGLVAYPLQVLRLYLRERGTSNVPALRALFLVLGKFPEGLGALKFLAQRWTGASPKLIEYK